MKAPFIPDVHIEREAEKLLYLYGQNFGAVEAPPVPVESILEKYLKLCLQICDIRPEDPEQVILGAVSFGEKIVFVGTHLDPEMYPEKTGQYNYTLGHEIGHWQLHRKLFINNADQTSIFAKDDRPDLVCRSKYLNDPIELQADRFAANLLMPRSMILREWKSLFPDRFTVSVSDFRNQALSESNATHLQTDEDYMNQIARPIARLFTVSVSAMRIRLETLGLLVRSKQPSFL